MEYSQAEILQTVAMTEMEHLDVRTVTLGLSLRDCASESIERTAERAGEKIRRVAERLVQTVDNIGNEVGIRIANKRIAVTPVSMITEGAIGDPLRLARAIDEAAGAVEVDFIGGYSALVQKGATRSEETFLESIARWRTHWQGGGSETGNSFWHHRSFSGPHTGSRRLSSKYSRRYGF